jgi:hypothetical protein
VNDTPFNRGPSSTEAVSALVAREISTEILPAKQGRLRRLCADVQRQLQHLQHEVAWLLDHRGDDKLAAAWVEQAHTWPNQGETASQIGGALADALTVLDALIARTQDETVLTQDVDELARLTERVGHQATQCNDLATAFEAVAGAAAAQRSIIEKARVRVLNADERLTREREKIALLEQAGENAVGTRQHRTALAAIEKIEQQAQRFRERYHALTNTPAPPITLPRPALGLTAETTIEVVVERIGEAVAALTSTPPSPAAPGDWLMELHRECIARIESDRKAEEQEALASLSDSIRTAAEEYAEGYVPAFDEAVVWAKKHAPLDTDINSFMRMRVRELIRARGLDAEGKARIDAMADHLRAYPLDEVLARLVDLTEEMTPVAYGLRARIAKDNQRRRRVVARMKAARAKGGPHSEVHRLFSKANTALTRIDAGFSDLQRCRLCFDFSRDVRRELIAPRGWKRILLTPLWMIRDKWRLFRWWMAQKVARWQEPTQQREAEDSDTDLRPGTR